MIPVADAPAPALSIPLRGALLVLALAACGPEDGGTETDTDTDADTDTDGSAEPDPCAEDPALGVVLACDLEFAEELLTNGEQVMWNLGSSASLGGGVYSMPVTGGEPTRITNAPGNDVVSHAALDGDELVWLAGFGSAELRRTTVSTGVTYNFGFVGLTDTYTFAMDEEHAYLPNRAMNLIERVPRGGGPRETVVSGINLFGGDTRLAVVDDSLFWTGLDEDGQTTLYRRELAGDALEVIASGGIVRDIAAFAGHAGYLYWSRSPTISEGALILRVPSAGGEFEVLHEFNGSISRALAFDASHMYWISGNELTRMPLAGGAALVLAEKDVFGPSAIAVDATHIYWRTGAALRRLAK